jgi:hypothetical protein
LEDRLKIWQTLFKRALRIIDSADAEGFRSGNWTFGGGTVLMRRFHHRLSKDIDIFVPDPQHLGYLSPRLNDSVGELTSNYDEQATFLKLSFDEGEIDFIVSAPLTSKSTVVETLFERQVRVETTAEILAKKIKYRGPELKARDIFDFALVIEKEPAALAKVKPFMREQRDAILARMATADALLRTTFAELEVLDYLPSYDHCARVVKKALKA